MENKKILIPIIIGIALLCGIVFTLVYKKTSEDPFKEPEIQTLAPKETKPIETKVQTENSNSLDEFDINETKGREAGDGKDIFELIEENNSEDGTEENIEESENNNESISESSSISNENIEEPEETIHQGDLASYIGNNEEFTVPETEVENYNIEELATDPSVLERIKAMQQ